VSLNTEWLQAYAQGRAYEIARIIRLIENGCCQHDASGCPEHDKHETQENLDKGGNK